MIRNSRVAKSACDLRLFIGPDPAISIASAKLDLRSEATSRFPSVCPILLFCPCATTTGQADNSPLPTSDLSEQLSQGCFPRQDIGARSSTTRPILHAK